MLRALEAGEVTAVQPLSALRHPILQKASASFGDNPAQDTYVGPIASVSSEVLLEIKHGQWRAGVWIDDDACWVITAGLAKGGHQDRDDFYKRLERLEESKGIASPRSSRTVDGADENHGTSRPSARLSGGSSICARPAS